MRLTLCAAGSFAVCPPSRSLGNVIPNLDDTDPLRSPLGRVGGRQQDLVLVHRSMARKVLPSQPAGLIGRDQRLDLSCHIFEALEVRLWLCVTSIAGPNGGAQLYER